MGRLIISENVTLDGVVQDPRGDEGLGRGDWFDAIGSDDQRDWFAAITAQTQAAAAVLLGRGSYEFFAARYPGRTGPLADRMNGMPKYVLSSTLENTDGWSNTTILRGEVDEVVAELKAEVDGDIVVYASAGLVPALLEHGLVDELVLMVYPLVAGAGRRLFADAGAPTSLRLAGVRTVGQDLVFLTYRGSAPAKVQSRP